MDENLLFSSELFSKGYGFMPKLVAKDIELSIEAKAIYSYLASYSGTGLSSFPSTSLILHDLGISENRYLKHRKTLIDKGYLSVKRERLKNGFSKNIYTLNQNPSKIVHLNSVHLQNVGIRNVGIGNEGTISNSFKSNNIKSNSNNKKILSRSDEQDRPSKKKSKRKLDYEKLPKHKYGEFNNVLLTDTELKKLKKEYEDWKERIDKLSIYIGSSGKKYKSHYLTILNWARKENNKKTTKQESDENKVYGWE